MNANVFRGVCISDTHETVSDVNSRSLFPRQIDAMGKKGEYLYQLMREEVALARRTAMEWIQRNGPWDIIVHHGDATGGYLQEGCHHPEAAELTRIIQRDMALATNDHESVYACGGNHDFGYKTGNHGIGIQPESVRVFQEIFKHLYWSRRTPSGLLLLGVCSPLAQYAGDDPELRKIKNTQEDFVADALKRHNGPWALFSHSPTVARHLKAIRPHLDRMTKMLYGDQHAPWTGRLLTALGHVHLMGSAVSSTLRKGILVPSTAPLWWKGYGLATFMVSNGQLTTTQIAVPRPTKSVDLPTSSALRCLWWMMRFR